MKKLTAILLASTLFMSMLVGCGNTATPSSTTEKATTETSAEEKTTETPTETATETTTEPKSALPQSITLMASQNWIKEIDHKLFAQFKDETGVEVKVLVTPDNGYETLLGTSLSGGSNAIDMFMYSGGTYFVSAGIPDVAADLSNEKWVDRLEGWAKNFNSYNGTLYGFNTWSNGYEGVMYNKTYFEENGLTIPKTWDEFITLCDKIVELGKIPFYENINGVWHTQGWFYGMTPAMMAEKTDLVSWLNESPDNKIASLETANKGLEQLKYFLSAKENGKPKYYTNDGQAEDWFGSYPAMQNRETVMIFTYDAYSKELKANGSTDEFGMFPCPILDGKATVSNGGGISKFINKNSSNVETCKLFLDFLARPENLDAYYAERNDFSTAAFTGVTTVVVPVSSQEAVSNSSETPPTMLMKDMLYWDPDLYKYCQGLADNTLTPEQFLNNMDAYRATMFEAAAE